MQLSISAAARAIRLCRRKLTHEIESGDAVIIRYEAPKGSGMPEMFYTTEAIASDPELGACISPITDVCFSGAFKSSAIGRVLAEAADGGPGSYLEGACASLRPADMTAFLEGIGSGVSVCSRLDTKG